MLSGTRRNPGVARSWTRPRRRGSPAAREEGAAAAEVDPLALCDFRGGGSRAKPRRLRRARCAARPRSWDSTASPSARSRGDARVVRRSRERGTARARRRHRRRGVPRAADAEFARVELAPSGGYGGGGGLDDAGGTDRQGVARRARSDGAVRDRRRGVELVIRLPASYPLASAELECATRVVGITEARMRKWMLGVSAILQHRNGAVAEGSMLWAQKRGWEFAGVNRVPSVTSSSTARTIRPRGSRCQQCRTSFTARACTSGSPTAEHVSAVPDAVGGELSRVSRLFRVRRASQVLAGN